MSAMVNGKIECCCAVATCRVAGGICRGVNARIIGGVVPNNTIAGGDCLNDAVTMLDCQVQSVSTWTSIIVCIVEGVVA